MPHYGNLENTYNRNEIKLELDGWINPVIVEYGYIDLNDVLYLHWTIKGTSHIFTIQAQQANKMNSNLDEHFKVTLDVFKDDFLNWAKEDFKYDWQKEYAKIFKSFLIF